MYTLKELIQKTRTIMRKLILGLVVLALMVSCEENENEANFEEMQEIEVDMSDFTLYAEDNGLADKSSNAIDKCHSMHNLAYRLGKNPGLAKKMYDIEYTTRKLIAAKKPKNPGGGNGGGPGSGGGAPTIYDGPVTIPVVINILEKNIGDVTPDQITSQIAILNEDFKNGNPNTSGAPEEFADAVADIDITFTLAVTNRRTSSKTSWGTRDAMKYTKRGGIDATDPANNLNIWVCEIGGGILGYAQFPGGKSATDGIVIGTNYFGETGGVYGDGRTATHEVGHWLNLRHIWGDGGCSVDDYVADTPISNGPNFGCPSYPTVHCSTADMTMNYMDYVYDDCMYMFSDGQNDRMRTLFGNNGARESFVP
jgi:pregnancy-associated plasma protein-A